MKISEMINEHNEKKKKIESMLRNIQEQEIEREQLLGFFTNSIIELVLPKSVSYSKWMECFQGYKKISSHQMLSKEILDQYLEILKTVKVNTKEDTEYHLYINSLTELEESNLVKKI